MNEQNPTTDLRGRKGPSASTLWLFLPLTLLGAFRVAKHVSDRFATSTGDGLAALLALGVILTGLCTLAAVVCVVFEIVIVRRARAAAGTSDLIPMNLSVNSYQQAFDLTGEAVFLPQRHQGLMVALRSDSIELFAGPGRYTHPRLRIPYSSIYQIERAELQLYGGKEPGLIIDTHQGPFELGFVRTAGARPFSIGKAQAEARFDRFSRALTLWRKENGVSDLDEKHENGEAQ